AGWEERPPGFPTGVLAGGAHGRRAAAEARPVPTAIRCRDARASVLGCDAESQTAPSGRRAGAPPARHHSRATARRARHRALAPRLSRRLLRRRGLQRRLAAYLPEE